jgi:hypothetical protein
MNGHLVCPPSRRGHSWRELSCRVPPSEGGPTIRDLVDLRVCDRCGAIGRVSTQGIVVATGTHINQEKLPDVR